MDWELKYAKMNENGTGLNPVYQAMQTKMQQFWNVLGNDYCEEHGLKYITKIDDVAEQEQIHDDTLCIINLDGSSSMRPKYYEEKKGDYYKAVVGAKDAVAYLEQFHSCPEKCWIQLWENHPKGVILDYEGPLSNGIPECHWQPSFHTKKPFGIM